MARLISELRFFKSVDNLAVRQAGNPEQIALEFYHSLRREVVGGNPFLGKRDQELLQHYYPVMMSPDRYPVELAAAIYANRRSHAVRTILDSANPAVLDAGCGYGSESFLFASLGAKVFAVDLCSERIEIAEKRKRYFEELFGRSLDIIFSTEDLNRYAPSANDISLTWMASVLAAVEDQDHFLKRIFGVTRSGGKVMVTDMNLLNPLFLLREWRRRRMAMERSPEFAANADFLKMLIRDRRIGARYFPLRPSGMFDDVQFFTPATLSRALRNSGFKPLLKCFSGFVPPFLTRGRLCSFERVIRKLPLLKSFGYFYLVSGIK